jgi:1-acylglycerone phosphate reductase
MHLCLGLRVIASARRIEALADLQALGIDTISLDVTDTAAITAAKEQVHTLTGGGLDIFVNNAYAIVYPSGVSYC